MALMIFLFPLEINYYLYVANNSCAETSSKKNSKVLSLANTSTKCSFLPTTLSEIRSLLDTSIIQCSKNISKKPVSSKEKKDIQSKVIITMIQKNLKDKE